MPYTSRPGGPGRGHKRKIGNGSGWGGPERGAGSSRASLPLFGRERDQPTTEAKVIGKQEEERRKAEAREFYYSVMKCQTEPTMTRLFAADKLLDRLEGKPVATNVNVNAGDVSSLSDAELAAELARAEREAADAAARIAEARGEEPPGNVPPVH